MIPPSTNELFGGTIGDDLDRIEIKVGKIGMNSTEQSRALLSELDSVYEKMNSLPDESRKTLIAQFDAVVTRLRKDASLFLRDLGGAGVLAEARAKLNPESERVWWYLDQYLVDKRRKSLRRTAITAGILAAALVVLGILYEVFLAPDPEVAARYSYQQSAQDSLIYGKPEDALKHIDEGLGIVPGDPTLLILRGVILEKLNRQAEAEQDFSKAGAALSQEEFLLARGQDYLLAGLSEKALVDAEETIKVNPKSVTGYLLRGQVYETTGETQKALADYETAYQIADQSKQYELAALSRTRMAMLVQSMSSQIDLPTFDITPTP